MNQRLIGIFGAGRNGSTLLLRLLDGSPGLWVYPLELNYLSTFAGRSLPGRVKRVAQRRVHGARYARGFSAWAARQLDELDIVYVAQLADPLIVHGDPRRELAAQAGGSLQDNLRLFLETVRQAYDHRTRSSSPLLVFKSLEATRLPRYQTLFPGMRFIHLIRHPLTNYASLKRTDMVLKQKPFWFQGGDILRLHLERRWIPHARFIMEAQRREPSRHILVKYEELCEHPDAVIRQLCDWLHVAPPTEPGLQTVLGGRRMVDLPASSSQEGVKTPERVVENMAKVFGYDDVVTEREREFIALRTNRLARQLGYGDSGDGRGPNRLALFRKWLVPDQWELMNADSRLRLLLALAARRCYIYSKLLAGV